MYHSKKILENSKEYKILKELKKKDENQLFLPIKKIEKENEFIKIYWKKIPTTVYDLKNKTQKEEWNCWKQICSSLYFLHSLHIIHCDVHLQNILVDKNKFYLIDFGISKKITSEYDKYYLEWKEDEFQLLWNLIFKRNEYPSDFSHLRKKIQEETKVNQNIIRNEIQKSLPKHLSKKYFSLFISNKPIEIKKKIEKIKFKIFLQRLYLLYFIFLEKPNTFYQKMYHSLDWKYKNKFIQ